MEAYVELYIDPKIRGLYGSLAELCLQDVQNCPKQSMTAGKSQICSDNNRRCRDIWYGAVVGVWKSGVERGKILILPNNRKISEMTVPIS